MFGQGQMQSSWANPQNQPSSTFGGFGGGGTTNAFGGNTSTFGSTGQQPPQQANPMFGNLGGASTSAAPGNGFSSFPNTTSTQGSAFGAKPTGGFGAFSGGGTGGFGGGGSAFGQTQGGSAFSATAPQGGIFGQKSTGAFGSATSTGPPYDGVPPVTTGTSNPPFQVFSDKENNSSVSFQSISCMPAYRGTSFEELRSQDYAQGRKTAPASGFGGGSGFGASTGPTGGGLFGSGTAPASGTGGTFGSFGQNAQQPQGTNTFGGAGTSTFGQGTSTFGSFGQAQQQPQQQQQQQQQGGLFGSGGSAFGQKPALGGAGVFGSSGPSAFGGGATGGSSFGQPQQQQSTTGGLFGGGGGNFGSFGSNANKPGGLFGQTAQPTNAFGGAGTGLFGQSSQQQPQQQGQQGSLFGGSAQQQQPTGGLFGQQQTQPQQQQQGTGLFGASTAPQGGGLFGSSGGGLFGQNQQGQQQQPQQQTAGGFGGGGLFGANANKPAGGGLFGGGTAFGSTGQQGQQATQTGAPSLFGNSAGQQQQGGLFGSTMNKPAAPTGGGLFGSTGGGLFGASQAQKPAAPAAGGLFGGGAATGGAFGSSTLGASQSQNQQSLLQPQQPKLTASIAQPVSSNIPIFAMLPPGPKAFEQAPEPKKKSNYFIDIPTRAPLPRVQLNYNPPGGRLRGFAGGSLASSSMNNALLTSKSTLGRESPERTLHASSLGSQQRPSVKKLVLDKKIDPSDLFIRSHSASPTTSSRRTPSKVVFSPALSAAAREKEAAANAAAAAVTNVPEPEPPKTTGNKFSAASVPPEEKSREDLELGDYWVVPKLKNLKKLSFDELSALSDLHVGRVGYGSIHFLEPVDLSGLPKLSNLLGDDVRFETQECAVYPDTDDVSKPSPGHGLNVKARIELENCWPIDKASREPIKDPEDERSKKHLKKLKNMKGTEFVDFDWNDGRWSFIVAHF